MAVITVNRGPRVRRGRIVVGAALLALVVLLLPAAAAAPSAAEEPAPVATITCSLSQTTVVYGADVTVSGVVSPASEGQSIAISLGGTDVANAVTAADGGFAVAISPSRGGDVVARLVADGTGSPAQSLTVRPKVTITCGAAVPFLDARYVVKVAPAGYSGVITTTVRHNGAVVATLKKSVRDGKAVFALPLRGVGLFVVKSSSPARDELGPWTAAKELRARGVTLSVGSSGAHVRGLLSALQRLKIRVPYVGTKLNRDCGDAVVAFQKAYRLPRTYVVDGDDWRKLDVAKAVRPRYASPSSHLEVDKGRQILMMVRGGKLHGLIAVSTGATGNTPEGSFRIQQKHPYTTSGYGGILFRTMGFIGNFAIHGYVPVPPYPASHGCIREPMWVADWVYDRTAIGERLYVYH
jgi:hypothetical protein